MNKLPKRWASTEYPGHNVHIPGTTNYLRSRTFQSWFNMMVRCYYPSHGHYHNYGGRGITVCTRWRMSFQSFLDDMGHRPLGQTLDRIDVNGGYSPANCRWLDAREQSRNQRRRKAA